MSDQAEDGWPDLRLPLHSRVYDLCAEFITEHKRRPTHVHFTLLDELALDGTSSENLDRETAACLLVNGARRTFTTYRGMHIVWDAPETRVSCEEEKKPKVHVPL